MEKFILCLLVIIMAVLLVACSAGDNVLDEVKTYQVESNIHSLDIQLNAADFKIQYAEEFRVESNLKYLSVNEKDGVLVIRDESKSYFTYEGPIFTLYIPENIVFDSIKLTTGAAKLDACALYANNVAFRLGAGDVSIDYLSAAKQIDVEGGAGVIHIADGSLNNLELEMGVGALDLTAALLGDNDLTLGVGEANITLIGSKEDYRLGIEKGLGRITVDGKKIEDFGSSGNGTNSVEIEGGIGSINLRFEDQAEEV